MSTSSLFYSLGRDPGDDKFISSSIGKPFARDRGRLSAVPQTQSCR